MCFKYNFTEGRQRREKLTITKNRSQKFTFEREGGGNYSKSLNIDVFSYEKIQKLNNMFQLKIYEDLYVEK